MMPFLSILFFCLVSFASFVFPITVDYFSASSLEPPEPNLSGFRITGSSSSVFSGSGASLIHHLDAQDLTDVWFASAVTPVFLGPPKIIGSLLNYPNPFYLNTGTDIGFKLQIPTVLERLTVKVYNMLGHKVADYSVFTQNLVTVNGFYRIPFNEALVGQLPAGGYYYLVFYDGKQFLGKGKMVVLPGI